MTIEHARTHAISKVWGVVDLHPWSSASDDGPIGEIWYERARKTAADPSLLIKLLFTSQPLSIQVHPDEAFAHSIGLPNGKTEAWYVLSATPDARVALGLQRRLTPEQLREAIEDGSIADLVVWHAVSPNDVIFIPAGTIHAIGPGLVIAEIQQRIDSTFRMHDFGRKRELHIENAIAVADAGPAKSPAEKFRLTDERMLLIANPHFVFERVDLEPNSTWCLKAEQETWLLIVSGSARIGPLNAAIGDAIFAQSDRASVCAGATGMAGLAAYTGGKPVPNLLQRIRQPGAINAGPRQDVQVPT
jgi:mannose-6-phosphate isomerase